MTQAQPTEPLMVALQAELGSHSSTWGPAWLVAIRAQAAALLREQGLPTKRDEAWKYTSVAPMAGIAFEPVRTPVTFAVASLGIQPAYELRLVNGTLEAPRELPTGLEIYSLRAALASIPHLIEPHLGRLAVPQHAFGAINAALLDDGVVIRVRAGTAVDLPLCLGMVGVAGTRPTLDLPRVLVMMDPGSRLDWIEWHQPRAQHPLLSVPVTEIVLGRNASLEHTRIQFGGPQSYRVGVLAVRQERGSRYTSQAFAFGGALSRVDLSVHLAGEHAECTLEGLYHVSGDEQVDHHTVVDHRAPACQSRQSYRGVVVDRGRAVFDGTVYVRRHAQQTSAHQENRHLVLSDGAVVNSKPRLEIDADQVTCGHGATVGRVEPEQLFYLRSRGLSQSAAEGLLIRAFAGEMLARVRSEPLRALLDRSLGARLRARETPELGG